MWIELRGYRCAHPPANGCHPFGMRTIGPFLLNRRTKKGANMRAMLHACVRMPFIARRHAHASVGHGAENPNSPTEARMLKETIEKLDVMTLRIPTDQPETDGTAEWDHTDMVVVQVHCGKMSGIGWSYASEAAAQMIETILRDRVEGQSALAVEAIWQRMN